jgi:hypothetical protein
VIRAARAPSGKRASRRMERSDIAVFSGMRCPSLRHEPQGQAPIAHTAARRPRSFAKIGDSLPLDHSPRAWPTPGRIVPRRAARRPQAAFASPCGNSRRDKNRSSSFSQSGFSPDYGEQLNLI